MSPRNFFSFPPTFMENPGVERQSPPVAKISPFYPPEKLSILKVSFPPL